MNPSRFLYAKADHSGAPEEESSARPDDFQCSDEMQQLEATLQTLPLTPLSELSQQRLQSLFQTQNPPIVSSQIRPAATAVQSSPTSVWQTRPVLLLSALLCLVVGFACGLRVDRALGLSSSEPSERSAAALAAAGQRSAAAPETPGGEFAGAKDWSSLLVALSRNSAESGETATERARWWEMQTGERFPGESHVADSRFEFCRLCHLAASNMATEHDVQ